MCQWTRGKVALFVSLMLVQLLFFVLSARGQDTLSDTVPVGSSTPALSERISESLSRIDELLNQLEANSNSLEEESQKLKSELMMARNDLSVASKALSSSEASRLKTEASLQESERTSETLGRRCHFLSITSAIEAFMILALILALSL